MLGISRGRGPRRRRVEAAALVVLACGLGGASPAGSSPAGSSPGDLDLSFGQDGKIVVTPPLGGAEIVAAQAVAPDGKLLVAGTATPVGGGSAFLVLRFDADGHPDPTFGRDGRVWTDLATIGTPVRGEVSEHLAALGASGAAAMVVQPDGHILVGGHTASGTSSAFALVRYTAAGRLDPSFGGQGLVVTDFAADSDDFVSALALLPDGRILVAGGAGDAFALARYLPDGRPDPSFGTAGTVLTRQRLVFARAVALDPAGRAVVAGQGGLAGGPYDVGLARYLPDGRLDPSFGDRGVVRSDLGSTGEWASDVAVGAGGEIVVAGTSGASVALARYLGNGRLDPGFGSGGVAEDGPGIGWGQDLVHLDDGRFLVTGSRLRGDDREVTVSRYLAGGTADGSFGAGGVMATDVVAARHDDGTAAVTQADGKLVVAGTTYHQKNNTAYVFLVRYRDVVS